MANHEINEDQDALTRALRMIETGDPVHADVYNALFSVLINNDVFLEKLANKMIQQAMISHVTDCTNPDMVMGADQGPVFTQLIEKVKEQVDVLNTKTSKTGHTHDDRYYTETEINSKLTGMATFQSINLTGTDEYVRFTNGYQICFGGISGRKSVTFGIAFSDPPIGGGFAPFGKAITYSNMSKTGVTLDASGNGLYIFMGRWK